MDPDALRSVAEAAGPAALLVGLAAGLLFSVNPVALAAIPVSLAYVTRTHRSGEAVTFGAAFIAGMIVVHVAIGAIAGLGGSWVEAVLGRWWGLVVGPLLIMLGIAWAGWVRLPIPAIALRGQRPAGTLGALLFGGIFAVAVCPVCTPALVVLTGVALASGSPLLGAMLLLAFAIGRAIPIAAGTWFVGWAKQRPAVAAYARAFEVAGGVVLIASGLYMLNAQFFWIPDLAI